MDIGKTTIERAFELAASGECASLNDLMLQLKKEGYNLLQIEGRTLKKQLSDMIKKAVADAPNVTPA